MSGLMLHQRRKSIDVADLEAERSDSDLMP